MNRYFSFAVILYLAAVVAAFGQNSYLIQTPGVASGAGGFTVYVDSANPLNPVASPTGPAGLGYVIAKPAGQGFYLVGASALESIDPAFATAPHVIAGLVGPPTAAAVTPDGNSLLVGATDVNGNSYLYIVSTTTDTIVGSPVPLPSLPTFQPGSGITNFCPQCFIAVSRDSTTAWVLTNSGVGSRVTAINLKTQQQTGQLVLFAGATSITLAPLGLLYVSGGNAIYEINPATLAETPTGYIQLYFSPYQLHFTPDGTTAYAVNLVPTSGGSILQFSTGSHQVLYWPPAQAGVTPPTFSDVFVAGNNRVFALDTAASPAVLADVSPANFSSNNGVVPSALSVGPNNTQLPVIAFTVSNELPNATYAFMLVGNGNQINLYRMLLASNTTDVENAVAVSAPGMQVVTIPPQAAAASFITYSYTSGGVTVNDANQVLTSGGAAQPLQARVLTASGLPVFNAQVSYAETDAIGGAVISNASTLTNADGYITANVSVPNACGTYTVAATVDGISQVFTITVPGSCSTTTGGGGNGTSQVSIVTGDGQIVFQNSVSVYPLEVLVTDTSGNPLPNTLVSFSSSNGACSLSGLSPVTVPSATTDANGHASTYFFGGQLILDTPIILCPVVASTQFGSVTFNETIALISILGVAGNGIPEFVPIVPNTLTGTITLPEGQPVANAIEVQLFGTSFGAIGQFIPNVGVYTFNAADPNYPGCAISASCLPAPASCVGSSNSDANGVTHCTLVSNCSFGLGFFPLGVAFGNPYLLTQYELDIVPGGPAGFNILAGNNQSGVAGQTLSQALTASLTDGCGNTVAAGTAVTWKVTQGTATISNQSTATNSQGVVSARVTLGQTPGPVTVTVTSAGGITATFTLTNSVVVSGITLVSGGGQSAQEGVQFPQPLVFLVTDNHGNPLSGIAVNFTVNGFASVSPASTTTNASGLAQTTATAAGAPGSAVISATTATGLSASATITTLQPGPTVSNTSFTNAASGAVGLAVCSLGTLKGAGIATGIQGIVEASPFGPLPLQLAGFSMTFQSPGGSPIQAPIQSVSNVSGAQQVNFQVPCELTAPGTATVVVTANGASTTVNSLPILPAQPGIFTAGGTYGVVTSAANGSSVSTTNFAFRGQTYYVWVTGLGQASPAISTDSVGVANQNVLAQIVVGVGNQGVIVTSAQYLQDDTGVYLIGFQIPQNYPTGPNQNLVVEAIVNGQPVYSQTVLLGGVQ
jgi:uncharacterized protein (TIGR03437 family)